MVVMKIAKLRWAGHVIRMSDSEMSKRIMNYQPERKKEQEGPDQDGLMLWIII
jgi:hypothetical protein